MPIAIVALGTIPKSPGKKNSQYHPNDTFNAGNYNTKESAGELKRLAVS